MKLQIVAVLAVMAVAFAAPQNRADAEAPVLSQELDVQPDGQFKASYQTGNGISSQSQGELKQVVDEENKPQVVLVLRGQYAYTDDQGQQHSLSYIADENGFQPQSADIPVAPVARR